MGLRVARNGVRGSDAPALRARAAGDHLMGEVGWTRTPQRGRVGAPRVVCVPIPGDARDPGS